MAEAGPFPEIVLDADSYVVKRGLVQDRYSVYDENGELCLQTTQPSFRVETRLPFVDADGNEVFAIESGSNPDDYLVTPTGATEPALVIEKELQPLQRRWKIRDRNEQLLAVMETGAAVVEFVRMYVPLGGVVPHTYAIETPERGVVGTFSRHLRLTDSYELELETTDGVESELIAVAAFAVEVLDK